MDRDDGQGFKQNNQFQGSLEKNKGNYRKMVTFDESQVSETVSNAFTRQGTAMRVDNDKRNERYYDGKIFCRTLYYSHRIFGVFSYYNDRLPRLHRLLILYVSTFLMLFLSGIFFYNKATTKNVGGWSYGHCVAFMFVTIILDWLIYMIFTFLFTYKPLPDRKGRYMQNGNSDSSTTRNDGNAARPFTVGKSKRFKNRNDDLKEDPNLSVNRMMTILTCIVTGIMILTCVGFIITMSAKYSSQASHLWSCTFALVLIFNFGFLESFVLYTSSKIVYKKDPALYEP